MGDLIAFPRRPLLYRMRHRRRTPTPSERRRILSDAQVTKIREDWAAGVSQVTLAREHRVSKMHISHIVRYLRRKGVP